MMINKRLIAICEDSAKYMKLTIFFNWMGLICQIVVIWLVGQFINRMISGESLNLDQQRFGMAINDFLLTENLTLWMGCFLVCLSLSIRFLSHYFSAKSSYLSSANTRSTLRQLIYEKLLRLGIHYQNEERSSAIVQVAVEGVEQLEIYFGKYLPQLFYSLLAPLTLFIVVSTLSWQVALIFMLCVPLIPMSIMVIMRLAKRMLKEYWHHYANLGESFLENLQGLTVLNVYRQDGKKHEEMNDEAETFRKITMKVLRMQLNSINVMDLIAFGGAALGTIVALYQFRSGKLQVGDLIIIILLSSEFFIPLRLLGSYFHVAMNGMAATDRIFDLLDSHELVVKDSKPIPNKELLEVDLKNIGFTYDGQRPVLQDVTFSLAPGKFTAIVGESGSGKSTVANLLLGQYTVSEGRILINGVDINHIESNELYEAVSLVSAHSHIFKGTIRENLLLAKPDASELQLMQALKLARIDEFIQSLPEKLETPILENGHSLSGGQKQRLALARTILGDRKMIIFDEATSNIDVESEALIWESIYELAVSKTILVISHRLANVKAANMIHVFEKGKIVESGTHELLMNQSGTYTQMIQTQQQLEQIRKGIK